MADIVESKAINASIKKYFRLNSILRHNALSSLNIADLATYMIKAGDEDTDKLLKILEESIDKATDQFIRTNELEILLDYHKWALEAIIITDLLDEVSKPYSNKVKIEIGGNLKIRLESYYKAVFQGIFRNAIKIREANIIKILIKTNDKQMEIEFVDNGKKIPPSIKSSIERGREFNSLIHDQKHIDLFIVSAILANYETKIKSNDKTPEGLIIYT